MTNQSARASSNGVKWLLPVLVALAAIYGYSEYRKRPRKIVYPPTAFYEVKRGDMRISVVEEGALRALNEVVVRSDLEGVNRIIGLVPEGAYVKKGELLVELDSSALKDRLTEQELAHQERLFELLQATENVKIQKSLAESQLKDAELGVQNAESDLEKYRDGDAPLLIKTLEARSGVLAEQVRISKERHARTQELFNTKNATRSELEADALSLKREELALSHYQEDLRLIKKFDEPNQIRLLQSRVDQAKEELERMKQRSANEIAHAEADSKTSERSVAVLEESLKTQQRRLQNAKIFAPQDGLVIYAPVSPFQSFGGGGEVRRNEGQRGGRGGGGGRDGNSGGGRRGGRSGSGSDSGGSSSSAGSSLSSQSGGQRTGAAASGNATAQSGAANNNTAGNNSGGGSASSGGRSASSGGGSASSSANSFASYPSLRPSSSMPAASTAANSAGGGGSGAASSGASGTSMGSSGGQNTMFGSGNQFGSRLGGQNFGGGFDPFSTPGILEEGTMVRQRQDLIRLPDVSKMIAEIKIHESRVRQVRPGMTAYVRVENVPGRRFKGTVRRVALLPDAQASWLNPDYKVFPTDVLLEDELPELKPGISARAEVIITNLTKVLSVPIQTVARFKGENVCFIQKGSSVAPVPVTTGAFNDLFIEITSGLKEGDKVLLAAMGDEAIEDLTAGDTNAVENPTGPTEQPSQAPDETVTPRPAIQRPRSDSPEGETTLERPRNRQRRPQTEEPGSNPSARPRSAIEEGGATQEKVQRPPADRPEGEGAPARPRNRQGRPQNGEPRGDSGSRTNFGAGESSGPREKVQRPNSEGQQGEGAPRQGRNRQGRRPAAEEAPE